MELRCTATCSAGAPLCTATTSRAPGRRPTASLSAAAARGPEEQMPEESSEGFLAEELRLAEELLRAVEEDEKARKAAAENK